jgi:DNA polymerase III psi subunit
MESQKGTPADLSEAYSKIRKQLFKNRSKEVAEKAIVQLNTLLNDVGATSVKILKAKCDYLMACCMLYVESQSASIYVAISDKAIELIKSAQEQGLSGLDNSLELITNYNEQVWQLICAHEAHQARLLRNKIRSKFDKPLLRQVLGEYSLQRHCDVVERYIMDVMPDVINKLLNEAIDYDSLVRKDKSNSLG